jgi:hypothetical protein
MDYKAFATLLADVAASPASADAAVAVSSSKECVAATAALDAVVKMSHNVHKPSAMLLRELAQLQRHVDTDLVVPWLEKSGGHSVSSPGRVLGTDGGESAGACRDVVFLY